MNNPHLKALGIHDIQATQLSAQGGAYCACGDRLIEVAKADGQGEYAYLLICPACRQRYALCSATALRLFEVTQSEDIPVIQVRLRKLFSN